MELEKVKFNSKYISLIREGIKTQTMRIPNKRIETPVGKIIAAVFPGTLNVIALLITKKGYKQFKNIDDDDAKREGFNTADELKMELKNIYPHLEDYNRIYYYQFVVVAEINADHIELIANDGFVRHKRF